MRKMLLLAAVIAAPLFHSPAIFAVDQSVPPPAVQPGVDKLDQRVEKIAARLGLNDFQKGELKELLIQRREAVRRADALSRRHLQTQLKEILSPEQRAKLADLMAARRKAMAEADQSSPMP